jgi:hypothetical protein
MLFMIIIFSQLNLSDEIAFILTYEQSKSKQTHYPNNVEVFMNMNLLLQLMRSFDYIR